MSKYYDAAYKVANVDNGNKQEVFFDPATIMLIASIISAIFNGIRLYCVWKNSQKQGEEIIEVCKNPRFIHKMMVARQVRRGLGPAEYRKRGREIVGKIFRAGAQSTPEEIDNLLR
jgi:hypothetical protein